MTIPQVFYNNEDLWTLPQEKYAGEAISDGSPTTS